MAQETTFALCEAANYTVRVYSSSGQTLMRAYDRQQNVVWMNQTPVSTETIPQGTVYTNTRGEQTVKLLVNSTTDNCTIQVGTRSPQTGQLLSYSPSPEATLAQVRQLYPEQVAKLEADCRPPETLIAQPYQNSGQPQRASFLCWSPTEANGSRSGQWLGTLPLTANDPTFAKPMTCSAGDSQCQANLSLIQARYPQQLQQAEFACAMKNGTLFFASAPQAIDMRCGYFATSLYDENGDGQGYLEQPTGVDISVGTVPLPG
ncbi:hypothetical protein [Nodosilinea sp. E11]|uniref:hypothetical protein n=1 Tax=Nodosilinea sp. E11 TaxID=3037479 RepID=UPI0029350E96|nr:hypothetical protein [Nodosilinea sp. E11]WOD37027.1 hypothetical protein RRF56_00790 [Nodosilinea sp. E11]